MCVCVYMYLFFTLEDSSCLAFKFSGLFWSAMEGQTQVKVLLFLMGLHLAQSLCASAYRGKQRASTSGNLEPCVWHLLAGPPHRKDKKQTTGVYEVILCLHGCFSLLLCGGDILHCPCLGRP